MLDDGHIAVISNVNTLAELLDKLSLCISFTREEHQQLEEVTTQLRSLMLSEQPLTYSNTDTNTNNKPTITTTAAHSSSNNQIFRTLINSINLLLFPYGINPGFKDSIKAKLLHLLQSAYTRQSTANNYYI